MAHVARELGGSRQCCAKRWVDRYRAHGVSGREDRSSRPRCFPTAIPAVVAEVIELRRTHLLGRDDVALRAGVTLSTASQIIAAPGSRCCTSWTRRPKELAHQLKASGAMDEIFAKIDAGEPLTGEQGEVGRRVRLTPQISYSRSDVQPVVVLLACAPLVTKEQ